MNATRPLVVLAVIVVLLGAGAATTASFTDGDEVAADSGVYLSAADSENGERYVEYGEDGEVGLRFHSVPPGARTGIDDLLVVGFAGYEEGNNNTTVQIDTETDRVTLYRTDTGAPVSGDTITLEQNSSVTLGASVAPTIEGYTETVLFTVDVPEDDSNTGTDPGDGSDGGSGGDDGGSGGGDGGDGSDGGSSASDSSDATDGDSDGSDQTGERDESDDEAGDGNGGAAGTDGSDGPDGTGSDDSDDGGPDESGDDQGSDGGDDSSPAESVDGGADGTDQDSESDVAAPTPEPAGVQFELLPFGWSLFAGFLAGLTNYLVQTRIRDVLPAFNTERSNRRERVWNILVREAVVTLLVIALTVLVAGVLSNAGITGITRLVATLSFSVIVGAVSGARGLPNL